MRKRDRRAPLDILIHGSFSINDSARGLISIQILDTAQRDRQGYPGVGENLSFKSPHFGQQNGYNAGHLGGQCTS